jgi:hypothetical protein
MMMTLMDSLKANKICPLELTTGDSCLPLKMVCKRTTQPWLLTPKRKKLEKAYPSASHQYHVEVY